MNVRFYGTWLIVHILQKGSIISRSYPFGKEMISSGGIVIPNNFTFSAVLIPGKVNKASDALSRFRFKEFRSLVPDANSASLYVPLSSFTSYFSALDSE